ncbi:MAG: hypothetical protein QMD01_00630 [Thermodesulfovibrionales bacterium]|nr:hypothetical protein [Thermodesulfovibrionales bacterium]
MIITPRINEATDTDLKVIKRLQQLGWPKARIAYGSQREVRRYAALSAGQWRA